MEQYILPMVDGYVELKVLAFKLRASFYHIYVLFHNQPSIHQATIPSFPSPTKGKGTDRSSILSSPNPLEGRPIPLAGSLPPGLAPISVPKPSASFLLPAMNYIPTATACFDTACALSEDLLSGSHPIRLSVKVEYSAYRYDCLHDGDGSRRIAQQAIKDVYNAQEGMDDEMFEDAADLVGILGKMMKRGLSSSDKSSTPRVGSAGMPETPKGKAAPVTPQQMKGGTPNMDSSSGTVDTVVRIPTVPTPPTASPRRRSPR